MSHWILVFFHFQCNYFVYFCLVHFYFFLHHKNILNNFLSFQLINIFFFSCIFQLLNHSHAECSLIVQFPFDHLSLESQRFSHVDSLIAAVADIDDYYISYEIKPHKFSSYDHHHHHHILFFLHMILFLIRPSDTQERILFLSFSFRSHENLKKYFSDFYFLFRDFTIRLI